jgi:fluoride exporter
MREGELSGAATLGAVAAGGAVGTLLRAGGLLLLPATPGAFPLATLVENLLGAFLLGCLVGVASRDPARSPALRLFLGPGVLGSFTTFSALAVDTVILGPMAGSGYLGASLLGGLLAAALGVSLGRGGS